MKRQLEQIRSARSYALVAGRQEDQILKHGRVSRELAIHLSGGIGDIIISLGVVKQLALHLEYAPVIYSSHSEVVTIFSDFESRSYKDFVPHDYWIWMNLFGQVKFSGNFSGFRDPAIQDIFLRNEIIIREEKWDALIKSHPHGDNLVAHKALKLGLNRETLPYHMFNLPYKKPKKLVFSRFPKDPEKYITVHNGFDTNNNIIGKSTKNWYQSHWRLLVSHLKECYPHYKIVQLGAKNSLPIEGVDKSFIGIPLIDSLAVLSHGALHIDGDSGLVHAAHVMGKRSVVLFGPTNVEFFGYPENINVFKADVCGDCWWLKDNWLQSCVLNHSVPPCMYDIKPMHVFSAIAESGILK